MDKSTTNTTISQFTPRDWAIMIIIIIAAGLAFLHMLCGLQKVLEMNGSTAATWFSGIATTITSIVAIGIALRTEKRLALASKKKAGLIAAQCIPQIEDITENAKRIHHALTHIEEECIKHENFPKLLPYRWNDAMRVFDGDTLTLLEPIENNAAYRAAEAFGKLRAIGHEIQEFEENKAGWHQMSPAIRRDHLKRFSKACREAQEILTTALPDFKSSARSER